MNRTKHCPAKWPLSRFLAVVAVLLAGWHGHAQNVQHLSVTVPGGMPGETNFITGITVASNGVTVTWDGPAGYYQLFAQQTNKPVWVAVTRRTDLLRTATLPARYSNALFRVSGPSPLYTGSQTCALCHDPILRTVQDTPHAAAFTNTLFMADGGQTNGSCLACHTVIRVDHGICQRSENTASGRRSVRELPRAGGQSRGQSRQSGGPAASRSGLAGLRRLSHRPAPSDVR
jgi:hypothetical protein